jgi:integrase
MGDETVSKHGAATRKAVYTGNRRVPGLYGRTLANGTTVFEAALRLGGKVRRHRLQAVTKTDAIAELRRLQVDFERGETHRSVGITINDLAADFFTHMGTRIGDADPRRRRSPRTVRHYDDQLKLHVLPVLGHLLAADLRVADLRRLLDVLAAKKLSPSTRTGLLSILSALMRYALKQGIVERNVVRDLDKDDRPGAGRVTEPRYLSATEVTHLLDKMGDTFRPAAAVCTYAGLRLSEALGLRWADIDFKAGTITVSAQLGLGGERAPLKTEASSATLPMLPALQQELSAHRSRVAATGLNRRLHRNSLVFTTSQGKAQGARNLLRAVQAAATAAGLNGDDREPVGVHDLRHTFVAVALASGVSLAEAASLARHANAKVTAQVYAGLAENGRETAAAKLVKAGFGR